MTELEARRRIKDLVVSGRITTRDGVMLINLRHALHHGQRSRVVRFLRAVVYVLFGGEIAHEPDDRHA